MRWNALHHASLGLIDSESNKAFDCRAQVLRVIQDASRCPEDMLPDPVISPTGETRDSRYDTSLWAKVKLSPAQVHALAEPFNDIARSFKPDAKRITSFVCAQLETVGDACILVTNAAGMGEGPRSFTPFWRRPLHAQPRAAFVAHRRAVSP